VTPRGRTILTARAQRLLLALLPVLLLSLAACGAPKQPSQPSGVVGLVLFEGGPVVLSPSALPAGFSSGVQGRLYPYVTMEIRAKTGLHAGDVVAKVKPDAKALFKVTLPPGTYVLNPLVPKHGPWPHPVTVVVQPGRYTHAIVYVEGM